MGNSSSIPCTLHPTRIIGETNISDHKIMCDALAHAMKTGSKNIQAPAGYPTKYRKNGDIFVYIGQHESLPMYKKISVIKKSSQI
jgi:hypothetical protein